MPIRCRRATDTWTATPLDAATPYSRSQHTAVWTGSAMVVWGGSHDEMLSSGALYLPQPPLFTPSPADQSVCAGAGAVLTAGTSYTDSLRWYKDGSPLSDNATRKRHCLSHFAG